MVPPTLVTIALSHFCEKARWGLDRAGATYIEQGHAPGLHMRPARRLSGRSSTPILVTASGIVGDSAAILQWASAHSAPGHGLYGDDEAQRAEVLALEQAFDQGLGPHVRRVVYFHLLPVPRLIVPMMTHAVPRGERLLLKLLFRPLRRLMSSAMRIDAAGAGRSLERVRATFAEVDGRLADGRRYLVGGRLSAADIAFAALAAPIVLPEGYAVPLPGVDELPAAMAVLVRELRATPAGQLCLRLYREERR
jgi:glutathione S-transferase